MVRRVLILTASYGSGHNEAARCIAGEVARRGAEPVIVDHFRDLVHPLFDRATRAAYLALLRRLPGVWGLAYALGDRLASDSPLTFGASRLGARRLGALLDRTAPNAVVTVHATPAVAMAALPRAGRRLDRKSTRLNSSHLVISYAVFCLKKKRTEKTEHTGRTRHDD